MQLVTMRTGELFGDILRPRAFVNNEVVHLPFAYVHFYRHQHSRSRRLLRNSLFPLGAAGMLLLHVGVS